MIDLHMHSKYSDGTDSIIDILKIAEENKLEYISITDHNNVDAYYELENIDIAKYYSGKIIRGVELNTKVLGVPIEILSYEFDLDKMKQKLEKLYISVEERNVIECTRLIEKVIKSGIEIDENIIQRYDSKVYASKFIHESITKNESNRKYIDKECFEDSNKFYRKYMSEPTSLFYVDTEDIIPNIEELYEVIQECQGLVFVPHIFEYGQNSNKILEYILENIKIDGIECFYTTFSEEKINYLNNLCEDNNLFKSGGSDYHGDFKKNVFMGSGFGNLEVPTDIIKNWIK